MGASAIAVALILGGVAVFVAGRSDNVKIRLGDDQFRSLDAKKSAPTIAKNGPIIFADTAGRSRDIYVQHLGADPETGWVAFDVRPAGEARDCQLVWQGDKRDFVDNGKCSRSFTFPADGTGLRHYVTRVEKGKVIVDLNADPSTTTTTAKAS
jgi:hypothetical protein